MKESNKINRDYEVDLKEFFSVLWDGKSFIITVAAISAVISVLYSLSLTNTYKSSSLLNVVSESSQSFNSGGLGSIASLAGISLPASGREEKGHLILAHIQSKAFLQSLIESEGAVLPSIMAAKSYDPETGLIRFDASKYDYKLDKWIRRVNPPTSQIPSVQEVYPRYMGIVSANQSPINGYISISVEHISPVFAKDFLMLIINGVNSLLQEKDLQESSDALDFLKSEMENTRLVELRNSMNDLIEAQLKTQMMARISSEYVLQMIEPPLIPEAKNYPNRPMICILGTILGTILGILVIVFRHYALVSEHN
ncbi:MAG: hypothetical protein CL779_02150 [Chloroflexi bacterium]|nr:hypothetical protein [Chloroflexota bacterium]|tara:strand:+ start:5145 stop:6077 length:933 start_codon:yes stop_codon:yes gene_type:complete